MMPSHAQHTRSRLLWLDIIRGMSITVIGFFHFFIAYDNGRYPWPFTVSSLPSFVSQCQGTTPQKAPGCLLEGILALLFERGPHAVAVFILVSGFALTYSCASLQGPRDGWLRWYRARFLRLFPLYWIAHFLYLVSPMIPRTDPLDYRFFLSLLGNRIYPIDRVFYYFNPAWWFFGMLLEFYLVFPVLLFLLRRWGPTRFLIAAGLLTLASRYLLVFVLHAHGNYVQGGFFGARLWEFACGMVLATLYRTKSDVVARHLFSWQVSLIGLLIYTLGTLSYRPTITYIATDALIGTGLFLFLAPISSRLSTLTFLRAVFGWAGTYSYSIYLFHQPYIMYFGARFQPLSMAASVAYATGIFAVIAGASGLVERTINRLIQRLSH